VTKHAVKPAGVPLDANTRTPLRARPGYLVRRLHQIHSAIFAEECRDYNVTPVQYGLLTALKEHPNSDQVTLGREVGIDRTNVADVLERLAERGLVRRRRSSKDRRSMIANLTARGDNLVQAMNMSMQKAQERLLEPLKPEFRAAFLSMLSTLVEANSHYSPAETEPGVRASETNLGPPTAASGVKTGRRQSA
jgi:DNA-binding MarR family transcriptional regulator